MLILERELPGGGGHHVLKPMHYDMLIRNLSVVLVTSENFFESTLFVQPVVKCLQKPLGLVELLHALPAAPPCALERQLA